MSPPRQSILVWAGLTPPAISTWRAISTRRCCWLARGSRRSVGQTAGAYCAASACRVLLPVAKPREEARPGIRWGMRHSKRRDSRAISHHYDVSNTFYGWLLGPTMGYTCGVYPYEGASLEEAQQAKVDLVCRKLDLRPGQRLLDVGCGWGILVLHAAAHYGVNVVGVTLSHQQAEWTQKRIAELGLSGVAEIRHDDYRNVAESGFDAVASIGLTEHIGAKNRKPATYAFWLRRSDHKVASSTIASPGR